MAHDQRARTTTPQPGARGTSGWVGWIAFAGLVLAMLGTWHVLQGVVALVRDEYFLVARSGLVLDVGYPAWGWTHVATGIVLLLAGVGVLAGWLWARVVGTLVAFASALLSLAFLAAYPVWAVLMIALAVVVVMALTVHGAEIRPGDEGPVR